MQEEMELAVSKQVLAADGDTGPAALRGHPVRKGYNDDNIDCLLSIGSETSSSSATRSSTSPAPAAHPATAAPARCAARMRGARARRRPCSCSEH